MKNTFKKMLNGRKILAGLVGATFLIGAMAPVSAAPVMPSAPAASSDHIQNVRNDRWRRPGGRQWNGYRPRPRADWHGGPYRPAPGYWSGHRGYRGYRHGYRRHSDGWWYPLAAFGAGAVIGGALASPPPPPVYRAPAYNSSHVQWCYNRYRSYRASDNTFQPYNGPRQQCYPPYR